MNPFMNFSKQPGVVTPTYDCNQRQRQRKGYIHGRDKPTAVAAQQPQCCF